MRFVIPMSIGMGFGIIGSVIVELIGFHNIGANIFFPIGALFYALLIPSCFIDNWREEKKARVKG